MTPYREFVDSTEAFTQEERDAYDYQLAQLLGREDYDFDLQEEVERQRAEDDYVDGYAEDMEEAWDYFDSLESQWL